MNLLSASSLQRVDACPASAVLPRVTHESPAGEKGTEIHAYLSRLAQGMARDKALALVPDTHRAVCAELPDPGRGIAEAAFAYDIQSGKSRELGRDIERQYGKLAPTEIPGSADFLQMTGDLLILDDYKTGKTEVPPAKDNLQLHFLALAAARSYGATKARVSLVHIHDDGSVFRDSYDMDAFDLAGVAERLRKLYYRVKYAAKAWNAYYRREIFGQGSKDGHVLAVDRAQESTRVRQSNEGQPQTAGASDRMGTGQRLDPAGDGGVPSVRQPTVCQPGASVPGNATGQRSRSSQQGPDGSGGNPSEKQQGEMGARGVRPSHGRGTPESGADGGPSAADSRDLRGDSYRSATVGTAIQRIPDARSDDSGAEVLEAGDLTLHEGSWCKYCPARNACPAKTAWLVRLTVPEGIAQRFDTLLTGSTARQAYEIVKRADEVLNDLRAKLYQWARENPIELEDGKVFGLTTQEREYVDGNVAWRVLREQHGEAVADAAVELSTSKAAIERALKEVAPRGSLAGLKRKALEEIGNQDGLQVKVTETIREHTRETDDAAKVA